MNRRYFGLVAAVAIAAAAAGACTSGSSNGGTQPATLPAACTLLTDADAQTALGTSVGPPTANQGGGNNCTYGPTDPTSLMTIEISVFRPNTFTETKGTSTSGVTITPASGLGDDAFFFDAGVAGTQLYVLKGSTAFYIAIFDGNYSADQIKSAEQVAAQSVLARL